MYVPVLVDTDVFQVLDYATPVRFSFEGVFETFGTLVAQGPRVLLADGRIERLDDVCKRHAIVFVQLAQVRLLVVVGGVHGVRSLHRCGASAETTGNPAKNTNDVGSGSAVSGATKRGRVVLAITVLHGFGRETTAKRKTKTKTERENALTTEYEIKTIQRTGPGNG